MALQVTITTPEGLLHRGDALKVVVPAFDGEMGFLPRHAPLVATLGAGELRLLPSAGPAELSFFVAGGFVQVLDDRVVVLATRAEPAAAMTPSLAEEELRLALAEAEPPAMGPEARQLRMEKIRVARARAKVAGKHRGTK